MKKNAEQQIRERIAHNEIYIGGPIASRVYTSGLTYGVPQTEDWLRGEAEAIQCENEFLRQLLK